MKDRGGEDVGVIGLAQVLIRLAPDSDRIQQTLSRGIHARGGSSSRDCVDLARRGHRRVDISMGKRV
jgi:hypothetical protein